MPVFASSGKSRRRIRFLSGQRLATKQQHHHTKPRSSPAAAAAAPTANQHPGKNMAEGQARARAGIPALFSEPPAIQDPLITETTELQNETLEKCLPFLKGFHNSQKEPFNQHGVPALQRDDHLEYLFDALEDYPPGFAAMDASRPWMVYWALASLSLIGEDVSQFRSRAIATFTPMQNPTGGFGGGHGQMSHCAPSYAVTLSLAMVGGEDAYKVIDRQAMWQWLSRLKQPDGGFRVCEGGEEDVRGAYCAMVMISLLNLPIDLPPDAEVRQHGMETFMDGLPEYLSRCQSFEGGISGSPGTEAHGAYAFCALACLSTLGQPEDMIFKYMNFPMLLSWLADRQYAPEGGFSGRTNKLVDGCYSHWVGGCWPLIQSALEGVQPAAADERKPSTNLYNREGLTRYIMSCCQSKYGGLRDKPGKHPDSYHTCYTLTGLSMTQNYHYRTAPSASDETFASAFSWKSTPIIDRNESETNVFSEADRLAPAHPLYVIPHKAAESMRAWSQAEPFDRD